MADTSPTAPGQSHMAHKTRSGVADRRPPRLCFPKLAASLKALPGLIGDAFSMAYVAPYASRRRRPRGAPEDALGGRDPNW